MAEEIDSIHIQSKNNKEAGSHELTKQTHLSILKNCEYGDELLLPEWYNLNTRVISKYLQREGRNLSSQAISCCQSFYDTSIHTFDGTITLGDMAFIAIFMERLKPTTVYEIGVASGYSSALILNLGLSLSLLSQEAPFLHSYDLLCIHSKDVNGKENFIGQVVGQYYPKLIDYWSLNINSTSFDIELSEPVNSKNLFFIDGGHEHPWPLLDIINIYERVNNKDTWVLMQDNRVIERWYQDSFRHNVEMLTPVRGVEIPFSYWPGKKISGKGGCYNMCAINLNVTNEMFLDFVRNVVNYWPNLEPENNYGCAKFRDSLQANMGDYAIKIKAILSKYL